MQPGAPRPHRRRPGRAPSDEAFRVDGRLQVKLRAVLLAAVVLAANAVIMSVEMLATRLLFPFYGNTIFVWSSVITIIIAGLFIGYMAGGFAADRYKNRAGLVVFELLASGLLVMVVPAFG